MRPLTVLSLVAVVSLGIACASTGSTGTMRMYMQQKDLVWNAALAAVDDLGARREFANRSAGAIRASIGMPEAGGRVNLEIDIRSTSTDPNMRSGADVTVVARLADGRAPDPEIDAEMRRLEARYLELLELHLGQMRGAGTRPY